MFIPPLSLSKSEKMSVPSRHWISQCIAALGELSSDDEAVPSPSVASPSFLQCQSDVPSRERDVSLILRAMRRLTATPWAVAHASTLPEIVRSPALSSLPGRSSPYRVAVPPLSPVARAMQYFCLTFAGYHVNTQLSARASKEVDRVGHINRLQHSGGIIGSPRPFSSCSALARSFSCR